jgi:hypothetical protein
MWCTSRPLTHLRSFSVPSTLKSIPLTHNLISHNVVASDYKEQIFIAEATDISELCQLSEQMLLKLTSPNGHYRYKVILALRKTIEASAPSDYLKDLAVRVFTLLYLDRFNVFMGDTVWMPAQEPTCHLLARCLMHHIADAVRILKDFHILTGVDEWNFRLSFWLLIERMVLVDLVCLDDERLRA